MRSVRLRSYTLAAALKARRHVHDRLSGQGRHRRSVRVAKTGSRRMPQTSASMHRKSQQAPSSFTPQDINSCGLGPVDHVSSGFSYWQEQNVCRADVRRLAICLREPQSRLGSGPGCIWLCTCFTLTYQLRAAADVFGHPLREAAIDRDCAARVPGSRLGTGARDAPGRVGHTSPGVRPIKISSSTLPPGLKRWAMWPLSSTRA